MLRHGEVRKDRPEKMLPGDEALVEAIDHPEERCLQHHLGGASQIGILRWIVDDAVCQQLIQRMNIIVLKILSPNTPAMARRLIQSPLARRMPSRVV